MCCKNCTRREIGCHASCGEYKVFKAAKNAEKERRNHESALDYIQNRGERLRASEHSKRRIANGRT